jgi:hypothetical protein
MINEEKEEHNEEKVKHVHEAMYHKGENNLLHAYRQAGMLTTTVRKHIKEVVENCKVCQKNKRSQG